MWSRVCLFAPADFLKHADPEMKEFIHLLLLLLVTSFEPCRGDGPAAPAPPTSAKANPFDQFDEAQPALAPATHPRKADPWVPPEVANQAAQPSTQPGFDPFASGQATLVNSATNTGASIEGGLVELRALAEKGDATAQYKLGTMFYFGEGVPKDSTEAAKWIRKAAEQEKAIAQGALGAMYAAGDGVPQDNTEAVTWFRKAANQGNANAQSSLGFMYVTGAGIAKDLTEASQWFRKAAEKGDANAQYNLGRMYERDDGVPKDSTEAIKWLTKSAEQGNRLALISLADDWGLSDLHKRKESQPGEANLAEAVRLFRVVAETGDGYAQNWLANAYSEGVGVTKDKAVALEWWRKAAMNGVIAAQNKLAESYFTGSGVQKNHAEALKWHRAATEQNCSEYPVNLGFEYFPRHSTQREKNAQSKGFHDEMINYTRKKAESGDAVSQWMLGLDLATGDDVALDCTEAVKWFRKSAEQGNDRAQFCLGLAYDLGKFAEAGLEKNDEEAARWYRKAAEQGNAEAQLAIGRHCYSGHGTPQDYKDASQWFKKAAEKSNIDAQVLFGLACAFGDGVAEDRVAAVKWLRAAANRRNENAAEALRTLLDNGNGVADGDAENVKRLLEAAGKGDADAQFQLCHTFSSGTGVLKDEVEALKWLQRAAEQGNAEAQLSLGSHYDYDSNSDKVEAAKWYRKAAVQGHTVAQILLGTSYRDGEGMPQNYIEAFAWYNIAAATGHEGAIAGRDTVAKEIGPGGILLAQQRSTEIAKEIEATKAKKAFAMLPANTTNVPEGTPKSSGSGTIVSARGHILTAAHVVAGATKISVMTSKGMRSAKVLRIDETNDVAVLKVEGGPYSPVPIAPSRRVRLGQTVATIGFPNVQIQGFSPKVTRGEISSLNGAADDPRSWQISVPVQPGNSGGPLLDENGNLIGIVVSKLGMKAAEATGDMPQNVNYAVKSAYALALLEPYLDSNAPEPNQATSSPRLEDMAAKAQQSVVLILVY